MSAFSEDSKRYAPASRRAKQRIGGDDGALGTASDFILFIVQLAVLRPGCFVVLYCRVSSYTQRWNGNLKAQRRELQRVAERHGLRVLRCFYEVGSGWRRDREGLQMAATFAAKHNAVLLAESTGRFIRNRNYHSELRPEVCPTDRELEDLRADTQGVPLATALHPDTNWRAVRAYESLRGRNLIPRAPGDKVRRRHRLRKEVLKRAFMEYTQREIARLVGIPRSTVRDWLAKHET